MSQEVAKDWEMEIERKKQQDLEEKTKVKFFCN